MQLIVCVFEGYLSNALDQGFPTFLRSRTTWAPRNVNAYHFFQNNWFDRIVVYSEEQHALK